MTSPPCDPTMPCAAPLTALIPALLALFTYLPESSTHNQTLEGSPPRWSLNPAFSADVQGGQRGSAGRPFPRCTHSCTDQTLLLHRLETNTFISLSANQVSEEMDCVSGSLYYLEGAGFKCI